MPRNLEIYYPENDFAQLNNSTRENYSGRTLTEISQTEPEKVVLILKYILKYFDYVPCHINVQTDTGNVNSHDDGMFAAQGDLVYLIDNAMSGEQAVEPLHLVIGSFASAQNPINNSLSRPNTQIIIDIEPPALAF